MPAKTEPTDWKHYAIFYRTQLVLAYVQHKGYGESSDSSTNNSARTTFQWGACNGAHRSQ
eukprot:5976738-Amphidinium_carterae.4